MSPKPSLRLLPWIGLLLVLILASRLVSLPEIARAAALAMPGWLGLAVVLRAGISALDAVTFLVCVRALSPDARVTYRDCLYLEFAASPLKFVTPGKVGELVKPGYLRARSDVGLKQGIGSLVLYKVVAGASMLSLFGAAAAAEAPWLGLVAVVSVSGVLLFGRSKKMSVAPALALMTAVQAGQLGVTWLCFRALDVPVSGLYFAGRYALAAMVGFLPVTPSGFGLREGSAAALMADVAPAETVLAASLLGSTVFFLLPAAVGLVLVPSLLRSVATKPDDAGDGHR